VQREGLTNVISKLGTKDDPGLPPGAIDTVLIVDAFQEMEEPVTLLNNVVKALKPNGLVGIIDYRLGQGGPGPEERVAPGVIIDTAKSAGLKFVGEEKFLPYQYFLRFGK
jgi:hypothetical protein